MRRQEIQLISLARRGDVHARCEVGRRYLLGVEGFARHVPTGIEYLVHESVRELPKAAVILCESLPLQEIVQHRQAALLLRAAQAGSVAAQVKLAVWLWAGIDRRDDALRWLEAAAGFGHLAARRALVAVRAVSSARHGLLTLLRSLAPGDEMDARAVALIAAQQAAQAHDLNRLLAALHAAVNLAGDGDDTLDEVIADAVRLAEAAGGADLAPLTPERVEASLDARARQGDSRAAFALGRALCGIDVGSLPPGSLTNEANVRRGAALLLRAADAGTDEAWLHLYRLHADHRLSVANPQMARFFLEKAAACGQVEAQRKLGALMLRSSNSLAETEQAIAWLHQAAGQGDDAAAILLNSLRLPLLGSDGEAQAAIDTVRRSDPWLALRLQLARDFGLTKLEALCVDPALGQRPWGLVVGRNPFITQSRRAAPRAIPAVDDEALARLHQAAVLFAQAQRDGGLFEGDVRRRSLMQRRAFERHGLDESMFFATASSTQLDTLRLGPKWAFRAREHLQLALAA
jgi:TPR repeat protein